MEFISNCIDDTYKIAVEFSKTLKSGDILALKGELGSGKTAFTSGIVKGLGSSNCVASPTFTIVNEYLNGPIPIYHFDLYRLNDEDDLYDIGIDEYLYGNGICIFEWPAIVENLAESYYNIEFFKDLNVSEDYRKIIVTKKGNL